MPGRSITPRRASDEAGAEVVSEVVFELDFDETETYGTTAILATRTMKWWPGSEMSPCGTVTEK